MIREAFSKQNIEVVPTAFFYDKACFDSVAKPADQIRMSVNSLTGLSEVIMWIRNSHSDSGKIDYYLPHLGAPENTDHDIVTSGSGIPSKTGQSPITGAWVVFGKSKSVETLPLPDDYYGMMAGCLFSEMFLTSENSNRTGRFGSMGSAKWRVPIKRIKELIKKQILITTCQDVIKGSGGKLQSGGSWRKRFSCTDYQPC